jgi:hypothetical protein
MTINDLDEFSKAYVECSLWLSSGDDDTSLDIGSVPPETLAKMLDNCEKLRSTMLNPAD